MNYISDCCSARPKRGTLTTWHDYSKKSEDADDVHYGTCSKCKKSSLFSEGE